MVDVKITYTLKLDEHEAHALKSLLGNMNDKQFAEFGITGDDRQIMRDIWDLLPYDEKDL